MLNASDDEVIVREINPSKKNNALVVQANQLVEARYKFSIIQTKIIHFLISQVRQEDEDFTTYRLKVKDLSEVLGVTDGSLYRKIKEETYDILKKPLVIAEPDGELQIGWLAKAKYYDNKGYVDLGFHPSLKPYLLMIKEGYTKHYLSAVLNLNSSYAVRLYVLLKQYATIGHRTITVDEFRSILQLTSSSYNLYGNIKNRIIKPAQEELKTNDKVDIEFEFTEIKEKRKVVKIKFQIKRKQMELQLDPLEEAASLSNYQQQLTAQLVKAGVQIESNKKVRAILEENPEHIERCLIHHRNQQEAGSKHGTGMIVQWILGKKPIADDIETTAAQKAKQEKKRKHAAKKETAEAVALQAEKAFAKRCKQHFEKLDKAVQEELLNLAETKLDDFSRGQLQKKDRSTWHTSVYITTHLYPLLKERYSELG